MSNALTLNHITKRFDKFVLNDLSLTIPSGSVMGLIGQNGAGKSTTIKLILNLLYPDSGSVSIFGLNHLENETEIKRRMGVVTESSAHPASFYARDVGKILGTAYPNWDNDKFLKYLKLFSVDPTKKCSDLSKGTRMKLSIASALCHDAELLILDEPTSGLDPVVRDEVLDILREFMVNENHSILISSHITSDLEKIADYITFLHEGNVLFSKSILDLKESYGVLRCSPSTLADFLPGTVYAARHDNFGVEALVNPHLLPSGVKAETASIEQIMVLLSHHATSGRKGTL